MGELEEGTENEKRGSRFKTRTLRLSNQRAPPLPQALQGTTEEPHAPQAKVKGQGEGLWLTSLLRDGAVVRVAGQGGCGLPVRGAAPGRPAPRQALH